MLKVFIIPSLQGRLYSTGEKTQDLNDTSKIYRVIGNDSVLVLSTHPISSCEKHGICFLTGHEATPIDQSLSLSYSSLPSPPLLTLAPPTSIQLTNSKQLYRSQSIHSEYHSILLCNFPFIELVPIQFFVGFSLRSVTFDSFLDRSFQFVFPFFTIDEDVTVLDIISRCITVDRTVLFPFPILIIITGHIYTP